jgi:GTP-binding protein Era
LRLARWLVCNKIDAVARPKLLKLASEANALVAFERTFMISSLTGDGIGDLKAALASAVPAGPWHYPEDEISDAPLRMLAAEITREKLFQRLHEEIPYGLSVVPTGWKDLKDGSTRIEQTIFVSRPSHRQIVLGKAGRTIKEISMSARAEIADIVEHPVHLFLFVKVQEKWADDPAHYREMGLEFPKD